MTITWLILASNCLTTPMRHCYCMSCSVAMAKTTPLWNRASLGDLSSGCERHCRSGRTRWLYTQVQSSRPSLRPSWSFTYFRFFSRMRSSSVPSQSSNPFNLLSLSLQSLKRYLRESFILVQLMRKLLRKLMRKLMKKLMSQIQTKKMINRKKVISLSSSEEIFLQFLNLIKRQILL